MNCLQLSWSTYWFYALIVPVDLATLKVSNLAFVTQSAPDRCRKIQKMNGFADKKKKRSELLEIAQKVFDGRDSKEDFMVKKMGHVTMH